METNNLYLTAIEYEALKTIDAERTISAIQLDKEFMLSLTDNDAEILAEKVQEQYIYEGFNLNYNINQKGKIYESLIQKFNDIGW